MNKDTNPYAGLLNTKRIAEYQKIASEYKISESTVAAIFSKGVDWYIEIAEEELKKKDEEIELLKKNNIITDAIENQRDRALNLLDDWSSKVQTLETEKASLKNEIERLKGLLR